MGWLGEYSDPADQRNMDALQTPSRPYEVAPSPDYWAYAAIAGALILVVWVFKKPALERIRANRFAILDMLNVFFWLCIVPVFLFWLAYKLKTDTWAEWAYSSLAELSLGFFGLVVFTVIYYTVSFVYKRTRSYIAGWIAFFVMLIFANQLLALIAYITT